MRPQNVVTAAGTSALILAATAAATEVDFKVCFRTGKTCHSHVIHDCLGIPHGPNAV